MSAVVKKVRVTYVSGTPHKDHVEAGGCWFHRDLVDRVTKALESYSSMCLDNKEERKRVLEAVLCAL